MYLLGISVFHDLVRPYHWFSFWKFRIKRTFPLTLRDNTAHSSIILVLLIMPDQTQLGKGEVGHPSCLVLLGISSFLPGPTQGRVCHVPVLLEGLNKVAHVLNHPLHSPGRRGEAEGSGQVAHGLTQTSSHFCPG